ELGNHLEPAIAPRRLDVLAEGVAIAHRRGPRHRRQQANRGEGTQQLLGELPFGGERDELARHRHGLVLALDETEHVAAEPFRDGARVGSLLTPREGGGEVDDERAALDFDERAVALLAFRDEGDELHADSEMQDEPEARSSRLSGSRVASDFDAVLL